MLERNIRQAVFVIVVFEMALAEGAARRILAAQADGSALEQQRTEREFARFLGYALASVSELENHLLVARDIRAITKGDYNLLVAQLTEVRKMLHGLLSKLAKQKVDLILEHRRLDER